MRLPRMTTRRWMVAVVVVAFALAAGVLYRRHWHFRERADFFSARTREGEYRVALVREVARAESWPEGSPQWDVFALEVKWRDWTVNLMEKYRRAARCPWLNVESDSPEPGEEGVETGRRSEGNDDEDTPYDDQAMDGSGAGGR